VRYQLAGEGKGTLIEILELAVERMEME